MERAPGTPPRTGPKRDRPSPPHRRSARSRVLRSSRSSGGALSAACAGSMEQEGASVPGSGRRESRRSISAFQRGPLREGADRPKHLLLHHEVDGNEQIGMDGRIPARNSLDLASNAQTRTTINTMR